MVAVAGASVALTAVLMRGGGTETTTDGSCALPLPEPVLVGNSTDAVPLRYQFLSGEQTEYTQIRQTRAELRDDNGFRTSEAQLRFEGKLAWSTPGTNVLRGQISFLKIDLDRVGESGTPGQPTNHDVQHLRSRDPDAPTAITAVRNYAPWLVLDDRGRQLEDHIKPVRDGLIQNGAIADVIAMMDREELTRMIFLELPVDPVKVGDRWKAGELLGEWQEIGTLVARFELQVARISADKRYVLIKAEPALAVDVPGQVAIDSKQTRMRLWALFDRERGEVASSALSACADVKMQRDNKQVEAHVELRNSFETRMIDPGKPTPP